MQERSPGIDKLFISATKQRALIWFVALIVFYVFSYTVDPQDPIWEMYLNNWQIGLVDFSWTLAICITVSEVSLYIDGVFNKKLPWNSGAIMRVIIQTLAQILINLAIVTLIFLLLILFYPEVVYAYFNFGVIYGRWVATISVVSLFISAVNTGNFLLKNWINWEVEASNRKLEAAEHQQAAMAAELQALKLQIDPHFIFNNLSVLSELILENPRLGYEYSERFSKVYRYLLMNAKKDLIAFEEELKFLESYIFLIKQRVGNDVRFKIEINESALSLRIPPLCLQLLVENAIKHNQFSEEKPLEILIQSFDDKQVVVTNTISALRSQPVSSGLGLKNIIRRYKLLTNIKPVIEKTPDLFIIKLPLL